MAWMGLLLASFSSCGSKDNATSAAGSAQGSAQGSATEKPDAPLEFVCDNETEGIPWSKVVFSESHGEMLFVMNSGAVRVPVKITKRGPDKVLVNLRWLESKDQPGNQSQSGTLTRLGSDRFSFDFTSLKGFVCKHSDLSGQPYFRTLTDLGFPGGKYLDAKNNVTVTFAGDAQRFVVQENGKPAVWYYRTIKASPDEYKISIATDSPGDDKAMGWGSAVLTKVGEDYLFKTGDGPTAVDFMLSPVK